jgi:hypothetical protein
MSVIVDYVVGYVGGENNGSFEVAEDSIPRIGDRIAVTVENEPQRATVTQVWPATLFQGRAHIKIDCKLVDPDAPAV